MPTHSSSATDISSEKALESPSEMRTMSAQPSPAREASVHATGHLRTGQVRIRRESARALSCFVVRDGRVWVCVWEVGNAVLLRARAFENQMSPSMCAHGLCDRLAAGLDGSVGPAVGASVSGADSAGRILVPFSSRARVPPLMRAW